jgi:hypothetical protein
MSPQNKANANFELAPVISELTKIKNNKSKPVRSQVASSNTTTTNPIQKTWLAPGKLTTKRLEQFVTTILPTSVQIQLNQPFGKDSINHSINAANRSVTPATTFKKWFFVM